jgi:hypothetical protein
MITDGTERTGLERERNREEEMKHDVELLGQTSEEEAKPKSVKGKTENKRPSYSFRKTRKIAPIVSFAYIYLIFVKIILLLPIITTNK